MLGAFVAWVVSCRTRCPGAARARRTAATLRTTVFARAAAPIRRRLRNRAKMTDDARPFFRHPLRSSDAQTRRHFHRRRDAEPGCRCRPERGDLQCRLRDARPSAALPRRGSPGHAPPDESFARYVLAHGRAGEPARLASSGEIIRGHRRLSVANCGSDRRRSKRATARAQHHA